MQQSGDAAACWGSPTSRQPARPPESFVSKGVEFHRNGKLCLHPEMLRHRFSRSVVKAPGCGEQVPSCTSEARVVGCDGSSKFAKKAARMPEGDHPRLKASCRAPPPFLSSELKVTKNSSDSISAYCIRYQSNVAKELSTLHHRAVFRTGRWLQLLWRAADAVICTLDGDHGQREE